MNSLRNNFSQKKDYVVPDCRVHQFAYELMGNVNPGSPNKGPGGGPGTDTGDPPLGSAKETPYWSNLWEDDSLLEDEL